MSISFYAVVVTVMETAITILQEAAQVACLSWPVVCATLDTMVISTIKKNVIMVIKNIPNEMESRRMTFNIFQVMIVKMTQTLVLKTRALWIETVPT